VVFGVRLGLALYLVLQIKLHLCYLASESQVSR